MARIRDIEETPMTAKQRIVFDRIAAGPRGSVEGPLRVWLHSPELAERAEAFGAFCRYDTTLPPRLSELAILTIAAHWRAGFEWHVHAPIAAKAGVPAEACEAILRGQAPMLPREDEAVVHALTRALIVDRRIPEPLFAQAKVLLGDIGLVDLIGIIGYYSYIAMTIIAFEVDTPGGDPFSEPAGD